MGLQISSKNVDSLKNMLLTPSALILTSILGLSFLLRIVYLGDAPFWKTELYQSWAARNFLEGSGFTLPSGDFYSRALVTNTFPTVLSFILFGYTEFAARLPSLLFSLASVVIIFLIGKELFDTDYGLISAAMLAFSFWSITWGTQARMYAHLQFFYLLAVLLFYKWYEQDFIFGSRYLVSLIFVSALGVHTHILFSSFFLMAGIWVLFLLIHDFFLVHDLNPSSIRKIRVLAVFSLGIYTYISVFGIPSWFLGYSPDWYNHYRGFLYYSKWLNSYVNFMFLFVSGLVLSFVDRDSFIPVLSFLPAFIFLSVFFSFKEPRFIFHIYPFFLMVASLPIYYVYRFILGLGLLTAESLIFLTIIFSVLIFQAPWVTFTDMGDNSHGMIGEQPNHRGPASYLMDKGFQDQVVISTEPIKSQWYLKDKNSVDYSINSLNKDVDNSGELIDSETGVKMINNTEEFQNIVDKNKGWIIASEKNLREKVDPSIHSEIQNSRLYQEKKKWGNTKIIGFNQAQR